MEFTVLTAPRYDVRSLFDVCLSARPGVCERFHLPGPLLFFLWRYKKLSGKVRTWPYFTGTYNFKRISFYLKISRLRPLLVLV